MMVGREREHALLRASMDEALAGTGQVVLVSGTAGIGKTTLLRSLSAEAVGRGAVVLTGHCDRAAQSAAYGPWMEISRMAGGPQLPILGEERLEDFRNQSDLFAAVRAALAGSCADRPLVVVLEDLHWADAASIDLLVDVGRHVDALATLIVASYRDDELTRLDSLYELVPTLVRDGARRIALRRLDREAVRSLVTASYDLPTADEQRLVSYLAQHADGNPLFVLELCRTLEDHGLLRSDRRDGWTLDDLRHVRVPPLIRQLIDARLERLDPRTRELLSIAAVIGQEVPLDVWAEVSGASDSELDTAVEQAVSAHLLEESARGDQLCFGHALIADALYDGVILTRRRSWHRHIAEAMEWRASPDPDLVAHHFRQGGDGRAAAWLVRAGERSQRAFALLAAAARFEEAAAVLDGASAEADRQRGWLLYRVAMLTRYASGPAAMPYFDEAERLGRAAGDPVLAAFASHDRGLVRCFMHAPRLGLAEMEQAMRQLDALPAGALDEVPAIAGEHAAAGVATTESVDQRRGQYVLWLGCAGQLQQTEERGEALLARLAPLATSVSTASSDAIVGLAYVHVGQGRPAAATEAFELARARAREGHDWILAGLLTLEQLVSVALAYQATDVQGRTRLAADAEAAFELASGSTYVNFAPVGRLPLLALEGPWDQALEIAVPLSSQPGAVRPYLAGALGRLHQRQGRRREAWDAVRAGLPQWLSTEPGDIELQEGLDLVRLAADLALDDGDLELSGSWLELHGRWLDWSGGTRRRSEHLEARARHASLAGEAHAAVEHAAAAVGHARAPQQPLALIAALRTRGELALRAGHLDDAEEQLWEAAQLADACWATFEGALTRVALAEVRMAAGDNEAAVETRDDARAVLAALGARPAMDRADALGLPSTGRVAPGGLSPRELDVIRLLAAGRSNKEIAAALAMSVRTAERHLANLYLKIHAHGRADAIAFAHRHGLL